MRSSPTGMDCCVHQILETLLLNFLVNNNNNNICMSLTGKQQHVSLTSKQQHMSLISKQGVNINTVLHNKVSFPLKNLTKSRNQVGVRDSAAGRHYRQMRRKTTVWRQFLRANRHFGDYAVLRSTRVQHSRSAKTAKKSVACSHYARSCSYPLPSRPP